MTTPPRLPVADPLVNIYVGDVLDGLRALPAESVQCCVTSPPYFGLRDYGVQGQIGLEPTPDAYVARMVEVFREVRRVLRCDGVLLLNIGDSYNNAGSSRNGEGLDGSRRGGATGADGECGYKKRDNRRAWNSIGIKHKDLIGIPWLLAFALRADGWWLRQDLIWNKPNPMPESVTDRCTKAHEYLFLLAKSERYYWDAEAIKEASVDPESHRPRSLRNPDARIGDPFFATKVGNHANGKIYATRNRRSIWTITTRAFRGAHFATFPPDLVQPCIAAGSSERGCCPECGSPWERVVERTPMVIARRSRTHEKGRTRSSGTMVEPPTSTTTGWRPTCDCANSPEVGLTGSWEPIPCTVLDPFSGSGTTGAVARVMGRAYVGTELNPDYAAMWDARLADVRKWWDKRRGTKPKPKRVSVKSMGESLLFNVA